MPDTLPGVLRPALVQDSTSDLLGGATADFNEARTHRYMLTRWWVPDPVFITFAMLNPSTADAFRTDPTATRVRDFARREGFGGYVIVNQYGLRATDPAELRRHPDPVGEHNDVFLHLASPPGRVVVAAWGANRMADRRVADVMKILTERGGGVSCLGTTRAGYPRHPLYVRGDTELTDYEG